MRGSVTIKVRPTKMALLVNPQSTEHVREAIRLACSLWGGGFFPIIPLHQRKPKSWRDDPVAPTSAEAYVRGMIDAYDPDILVRFSATLPTYLADARLRVIEPHEIWERTQPPGDAAFGLGVFSLLDDVYKHCFKYTPKYRTKVTIPKIPEKLGAFWASVFGEYSEAIQSIIHQDYDEPLEIERPVVTADSIGSVSDRSLLFPRRLTAWGTKTRGISDFGRNACVLFMDATKLEDIVDYWNLRASGRYVVPMPKQFASNPSFKAFVETFLIETRRAWPHNPKHFDVASIVRSRHTTMAEMEAFAKSLNVAKRQAHHPEDQFFVLQHWYPRVWHDWARNKDGGIADIYADGEHSMDIDSAAELHMRLRPLLPEFLNRDWFYTDALCVNEMDLRLYGSEEHLAEVYPKIEGDHLARAISGGAGGYGEWRVGRHGLVRVVKDSLSESRKVPASETIFFAWLEDRGWRAELSPPGVLAKQIFKRLNGYPRLLANTTVLGLLEHMNGGSVHADGTPIKNNRTSTARDVAVGEVKQRLSGNKGRSLMYDTLLEKGVFRLGLRAKCPSCQRHSWFALSTLSESLECPKCLSTFAAAGTIDQSKGGWSYRTGGPFSVPNYADGAFAVLLTIDALGHKMFSTLRTTSVPSFVAQAPGQPDLEADFAMFWTETMFGETNTGLLFGECKTYGAFEKRDFARMQHLGTTFPGAVLVFSTLRQTLSAAEVAALRRLANRGRKHWKGNRPTNPILILTGTELLHIQRPPFCWDASQQERFRHAQGLLGLCDATQQMYLGLPPVQQHWREQFERRRARLATDLPPKEMA